VNWACDCQGRGSFSSFPWWIVFLKLYIYIYPFHGRCNLTFHQNIKEFSIGIPVLVATFTGFPAPWRRRKIRKSQKKRRRPVGDGQKTKYQHSSYVDGRNHAACSGAPVNDILHVNQSASGRISSINTMKYQQVESHLRPSHFLIVFFWFGAQWFGIQSNSERDFLLTVSLELQKVQTETIKSKLGLQRGNRQQTDETCCVGRKHSGKKQLAP